MPKPIKSARKDGDGDQELLVVGGREVALYPLFHPAAALRTPKVKEQLREDFARLPALIEKR